MIENWNDELTLKALVIGLVIVLFLLTDRVLKRKADQKRENFFRQLYSALIYPVQLLFFISVIYAVVQQFGLNIEDNFWVNKAYIISLICGLSWLSIRIVRFASDRILRRFNVQVKDNLHARAVHTQINVVRRLIVSMIFIVAVAAILTSFDEIRSLGLSLLASAGVAGIVLGLAAQKTIGNFFTGIQIAITQPIRLDDSVVVEGEWGWIEEINLTYVVVKLWDLRRLILPISYFVEKPFQNWTRQTAEIIGSVFLYLDYTMPIEPLRQELDRILEHNEMWNKNVKAVQVTSTNEKAMEIRVLVSAADAPATWDLRCEVREKLLTFIQDNYPDKLPRIRGELEQTK